MREFLIGTGFYAPAASADKANAFGLVWDKFNAVSPVVVVDNSDCGYVSQHRTVRVQCNLGRFERIWQFPDVPPDGPMLCGWSVSWVIPALIAYSEYKDLVYIEQDCLCLGDWPGQLMSDIVSTKAEVLLGPASGGQSCEVSFFWIARDYIPWAVREYLVFPGDNRMLTEDKFLAMHQKHPSIVGFHSLGPGRSRPIPATGAASVQQLTGSELDWVINTRT